MLAPAHERVYPRPDAEEIAVQAFAFIAWRSDQLEDFLFVTGLTAATVREAATTPQFLAGILDYVVADRRVLYAVARSLHVDPMEIDDARRELLPGMCVTEPVTFGPGPLVQRCEHCGRARTMDRRRQPHVPARVTTIAVARCGPCGGGFDGPETWLDANGNELG